MKSIVINGACGAGFWPGRVRCKPPCQHKRHIIAIRYKLTPQVVLLYRANGT
jgi:hypothetical protein